MSLTSFLADESLGAWADDVADLPTARTFTASIPCLDSLPRFYSLDSLP
jgi:hypothetical protein